MSKKQQYIKIFANILFLIIILLSIKFIFPYIISLFLPFILSYIVALIAEPLVNWLEKKVRIKRQYSSLFIIIAIISGLISIVYFCIKKIYDIVIVVIDDWSGIYTQIETIIIKIDELLTKIIDLDLINVEDILIKCKEMLNEKVIEYGNVLINFVSDLIANIPMGIFVAIIMIMASYFIIVNKNEKNISKKIFEIFPKLKLLKEEVIDVMIDYFKAQFKIMFIIFIILCIGFGILKIENFIIIALFVSFIDLLPIFGTGTILYPWMAIELLYGNVYYAIGLLIIYLIALVSRQFLQPIILGCKN